MKIKEEHLVLKLPKDESFDKSKVQQFINTNEAEIRAFIESSRENLNLLKKEIFNVLDAGLLNAQQFNISTDVNNQLYFVSPSQFLETAYTVEEWDNTGKPIANRNQPYINAGTQFADYCDSKDNISEELAFLNDISKIIGIINTAISGFNKVEMDLNSNDDDKYMLAALHIDAPVATLGFLLKTVNETKIATVMPQESAVDSILTSIKTIFENIKDFFSNLGKTPTEQYKDKYKAIKDKYTDQAKPDIEEQPDLPGIVVK